MYTAKVEAQLNICAEDKLCMSCAENTLISIACFYQAALRKNSFNSRASEHEQTELRHLFTLPLVQMLLSDISR